MINALITDKLLGTTKLLHVEYFMQYKRSHHAVGRI